MADLPRSYKEFVRTYSERNPCLRPLASLLEQATASASFPPAIYSIQFDADPGTPSKATKSNHKDMMTDIENIKLYSNSTSSATSLRRIFIIEDIDTHTIRTLGESLDINPLFFANYILTDFENIETHTAPPTLALLPSKLVNRDCVHLHHQQILKVTGLSAAVAKEHKFITAGNIKRGVRCPPVLSGVQPAIIRSCCSAFLKRFGDASWICVILIDRVTGQLTPHMSFPDSRSPARLSVEFASFQGGSEDFVDCDPFSKWSASHCTPFPPKISLLQNMLWYYEQTPPGLDVKNPSLLSLLYYPLKEISSRWILYVLVINRYSKFYEYSVKKRMNETLETDILDLQRWRRRARQSVNKITLAVEFIRVSKPPNRHSRPAASTSTSPIDTNTDTQLADICAALLKDYQHIVTELRAYNRGMEFIISMATAMVQFTVARQSTVESVNIRRLTYIALVFAPLGLAAGLFSMAEDFIPGHSKFWIYIVTSITIVLLVLGVSLATDSLVLAYLDRIRLLSWKRFPGRLQGLSEVKV
ncbi:hypothetical protein BDW59DRAFT_156575 [Aspergillus cavernicola]|uniref:Uncharacterized protein n=1 Tax=Aspergillus cavernicola TaxID=176166 RepID=A0ABR4J3Z6_9EURO